MRCILQFFLRKFIRGWFYGTPTTNMALPTVPDTVQAPIVTNHLLVFFNTKLIFTTIHDSFLGLWFKSVVPVLYSSTFLPFF